jgi:UDP-N-acetyl-D-mannosaminouronate:lipid I N-acetyl-D-mannosaminouronosyltransferase
MNRVDFNGVKVFPFTSADNLIDYIDEHKGILVAINAEKILHADNQMKDLINSNVGYCDGSGALIAMKQRGFKDVCKIPGCELWLKNS